jgi:hypothetical protein
LQAGFAAEKSLFAVGSGFGKCQKLHLSVQLLQSGFFASWIYYSDK